MTPSATATEHRKPAATEIKMFRKGYDDIAAEMPSLTDVAGVNILLLWYVIDLIKNNPLLWDQSDWRCSTGMCVGGWAATLTGGKFLIPYSQLGTYGSDLWSALVPAEGDDPYTITEYTLKNNRTGETEVRDGIEAVHRASRVLGIESCHSLFGGNNTLQGIERYARNITTKAFADAVGAKIDWRGN